MIISIFILSTTKYFKICHNKYITHRTYPQLFVPKFPLLKIYCEHSEKLKNSAEKEIGVKA